MTKKVAIIDIDGTISDPSHRLHYILNEPKNYDEFYAKAKEDLPITSMLNFVKDISKQYYIVFLTGRPERIRKDTVKWLVDNGCDYRFKLIMRKNHDYRQDYKYKLEHIVKIKRVKEIAIAIDDRDSVLEMLQNLDVPCLKAITLES